MNTLQSYFAFEFEDLMSMERVFIPLLAQIRDSAQNEELRKCLSEHLSESEEQLTSLEGLGISYHDDGHWRSRGKVVEAMADEVEETVSHDGDPLVKDVALIALAQKIEHYEIVSYGCAKAHADALEMKEVAHLLDEVLQEEKSADEKLSKIAQGGWFTRGINEVAEDRSAEDSDADDDDITPEVNL